MPFLTKLLKNDVIAKSKLKTKYKSQFNLTHCVYLQI